MEYAPGGDLMNQLMRLEVFSEEETRFYIAELVLAVESIHKFNYIHRFVFVYQLTVLTYHLFTLLSYSPSTQLTLNLLSN